MIRPSRASWVAAGAVVGAWLFVGCGTSGSSGGVPGDGGTPVLDAAAPDTSTSSDAAGRDGAGDATTSDSGVVDASVVDATDAAPVPFALTTTAFAQGTAIPAVHACNAHMSPPLAWTPGPAGTQSYALVMIDKTRVGTGDEVHWVLFDVPATTLAVPQDLPRTATLAVPAGAKQVTSFDGLPGYFGPCPPVGDGAHVYEWRVYARSEAALGTLTTATGKQAAAAAVMAGALAVTNAVSGTFAR